MERRQKACKGDDRRPSHTHTRRAFSASRATTEVYYGEGCVARVCSAIGVKRWITGAPVSSQSSCKCFTCRRLSGVEWIRNVWTAESGQLWRQRWRIGECLVEISHVRIGWKIDTSTSFRSPPLFVCVCGLVGLEIGGRRAVYSKKSNSTH